MRKNKPPVLLVCDEMISSITNQMIEIKKFDSPSTINFLYCYTLFEGLIRELCFQLFYAFPEKLNGNSDKDKDDEKLEIDKKSLLLTNDYYFILNSIIDKKLKNKSKDNMFDYLKFFEKISGIELDMDENFIREMSKARNIIAHNNAYKIKPWYIGSMMDSNLLRESNIKKYIETIKSIIGEIEIKVKKKYEKYTYEKLILDSWEYTAPTFCSIYQFFDFSKGSATINKESARECVQKASSGERYILSIWLENYNPQIMYEIMSGCGMVNTTAHNTMSDQIRFLHELFIEFPYLVNQQEFKIKDGELNG